jgi:hypothetical protein
MHIQANVLPSSPISIATTDLADALSEEGFPVLDDDPCNSVNLPFASTTPPDTSHVASTPAASHAGISSMTPAAAANVSALATINNSSAVDDSIPNHVDAATVSTANNSIADPADATASPVSAAAVLIPVVASQRWYCITIGKQVGVFQGM